MKTLSLQLNKAAQFLAADAIEKLSRSGCSASLLTSLVSGGVADM